jgi:hypothetical protein
LDAPERQKFAPAFTLPLELFQTELFLNYRNALLFNLLASFFISLSRAILTTPLASSKRLSRRRFTSRALSFARSKAGVGT